jgi:hypothetical protein
MAVHYPADCEYATINSLIASASVVTGDTIELPNGTPTWTSHLQFSKSIHLTSANGPTATIISDGVDKVAGSHMMTWTVPNTGLPALSGIGFDGGAIAYNASTNIGNKATVRFTGTGQNFRVGDCNFVARRVPAFIIYGRVCGVMHDSTIEAVEPIRIASYCHNGQTWAGAADYGDGSWTEPYYLGTAQAFYFERVTGIANGTSGPQWVCDGWYGSRTVWRNCTLTNVMIVNHGTESGGRQRGGRSYEYYNNTFTYVGAAARPGVFPVRSGNGVVWGNEGTGNYNAIGDYGHYRLQEVYAWKMANGVNGWDLNDTTSGPLSDGVFASGTHTGGASTTLTDSSKNWTITPGLNYWSGAVTGIPYVVRNLTQFSGERSAVITANGASTLTLLSPTFTWATGDAYEIRLPTRGIDQVGVGAGDLASGNVGQLPTTPASPTWLNQVDEASYDWNNRLNDAPANMNSRHPTLVHLNRDFYNLGTTPLVGYTPYTYPHPLSVETIMGFAPEAPIFAAGVWDTIWEEGVWQSESSPSPGPDGLFVPGNLITLFIGRR